MLGYYFKIAFRNLVRQRGYSLMTMAGLAIGFASCLVIGGYVIHENTYEEGHKNAKQIYRVTTEVNLENIEIRQATSTAALGPAAQTSIPEVKQYVRVASSVNPEIAVNTLRWREPKIFFTEQSILDVFTIPFVQGNAASALQVPFSLLLDEQTAKKCFGRTDVVGQMLRLTIDKAEYDFTITGVFRNMPSNTVLQTSLIASFSLPKHLAVLQRGKWQSLEPFYNFLLLAEKANPEEVRKKLNLLGKANFGDGTVGRANTVLKLQSLGEIYRQASGELAYDFKSTYDPVRARIFFIVALLLLLLAAVNYINLSTAKAVGRMKEVAVRKTCGSARKSLVAQFMAESTLLSVISMGLALLLFQAFERRLEHYLTYSINIGTFSNPWFLCLTAGLTLFVGIGAGAYPAYLLSRFKASSLFNPSLDRGSGKFFLRQVLIVFQCAITIGMIGFILVVAKQVGYLETKDPGFDRNNLLVLSLGVDKNADLRVGKAEDSQRLVTLTQELEKIPGIQNVTQINQFPAGRECELSSVKIQGNGQEKELSLNTVCTDPNFLSTFKIQLVAGRNFLPGAKPFQNNILINETAAREYGNTSPIGEKFLWGSTPLEIVGIVKDFHTNSLHEKIRPTMIMNTEGDPIYISCLVVRYQGKESVILDRIRRVWKKLMPAEPFDYEFADHILLAAYGQEERLGSALAVLCGLVVTVACLGIYGLSLFTVDRRTKEIGIRKVLGASLSEIIFLLSGEYARWMAAANLLAWPVAWWAAEQWLRDYSYHTSVSCSEFVIAGCAALAIALFTAGYHTVKLARSNPVNSLRYE